ncbi:dentin sialophosphoprotein isoform X2 [Arabidopsis lyrata subsp. lyrata]|uniref:dentin sialophosphoprotein isoform X2 n=1 Tax=Arabidopsis lyrata subsp. lyrata TaxID=81972 RepID=UPI000A29CC7A|nr:dentin sialophosphoprotein isoform X2 [Arabidopsis lyrata subsp. lyrata]|eukprot:XP_020889384.1 dentin sialophosphoprotein isoform X2 [Arabidopsis lyrata subsp. lyrata]
MYKGSSKRGGRGGNGGGSGGPSRNRNSFPPPTNRHPSPVGRMSSGGGGGSAAAPRQRSNSTNGKATAATTVSSRTVEETFNLVPRESSSAFGMIIKLAPDLVEEIKRVEAQGGAAKIKFDAYPNNSTGNIINVGGKEFRFNWSRERGDLCDIYEEHQSGEDGNGLLIEAGCAWRKLNVQRTLDESTTSHMKMRSVEAEQRTKSRKAIVLDPGNPSLTKQLAHAEGSPWRMSNKQKKEPPPKKRKVDPPPVPVGGPKPSFRPGASTPTVKNRLSASPGPSPIQTKGREKMLEREPSTWKNNALRDTSGREATNVSKEIDLQSLLVDILKEAPMSLKALEKAVGDRIPNAAKKIEPILKKIANFQAPRYFLKPEAELESYKKHSPDNGSSPEHQQLLPITECSRDQLPVPGGNNMEKISLCEQNGEGSLDCLAVHLTEQLSTQENVDIEHHSPGLFHEEKRSENSEGQARSSSDSDSDSDNSDSGSDSKSAAGSDSGSSSDSEASSNSKDGSDEDVDIMSDGDREPLLTIQSAEQGAIDLPGHGSSAVEIEGHDSDAVDIDGHDSDAVDIDGHGSDAVDVEGNSSDEGHGSEADRKKLSGNSWKTETATGTSPPANEEVGISGQEHFASGHDNLRERQNFIGQLFDDTENTTKDNFKNDKRDISERLAKDQNQKTLDFEHYSQKSAREKNRKSQSCNQLPAISKDSQRSELKYDAELRNASASQTIDPLRGLQKSSIEKSNRHDQMKPVDSSGKSNKHSDALGNVRKPDEGDHFPHEMLSSRSGKAFRDNQRDDVHLKNKFPRNKKDGESAIRPSLPTETSDRKHGELDGSDKDPKNVSGLSIGSSPLDSQRTYLAKSPKENGSVLQKQVSELELGELPEPLGEDTALKPLEDKTSFRQSNLKPSTSEKSGIDTDKRRSKKSDSKKSAPPHAVNCIKELPEHIVEDSERSQKWALQSHGQNLTGTDTEIGSQNKNLEDAAYKSRQKDSRARVGNSVEGYGETNKKTPVIKHGSKRASTSRSSRESKRHASVSNSINGHKDATSIPGDSVVREKRMTSFGEEDSSYLKYEKASPELKGPISDHLQYKAYMQEYIDKYDSYCSINKILESHRNDFQKLGQDLGFAKGRDVERYNKIVEQIKESYCKYGERHKRLKKVFVVLHEELKELKQRMRDYASSHGKD